MRTANDTWQPHAGLIESRQGPREGAAIVGEKNDERVVVLAGLFQDVDQAANTLVHAGNRLIVLGDLSPSLGSIGEELWDKRFRGIVFDLAHSGIAFSAIPKGIRLWP